MLDLNPGCLQLLYSPENLVYKIESIKNIFFFASPETFMLFIFLPIQKSLHDNNAHYGEWCACVREKEAQDLMVFLPIFLLQLVCLKQSEAASVSFY